MGQAAKQGGGIGEVTPLTRREREILTLINSYARVLSINTAIIKPCMDISLGYRYKYLFQLMLTVNGLINPSKSNIIEAVGYCRGSCIRSIDYLHSIGYLRQVPKPRLIKPFQKYKVDNGYQLTDKGREVLYKIIASVL